MFTSFYTEIVSNKYDRTGLYDFFNDCNNDYLMHWTQIYNFIFSHATNYDV